MRENRTCGSEGGEGVSPSRPLSGPALPLVRLSMAGFTSIKEGIGQGGVYLSPDSRNP